jgi:threonine/homoserine/homoserine lactone efflux protein
MINNYLIYVTLAITITAIPGPAVVLTIKNSLSYGYKASIANILGNFVAMITMATLSALGLGTIILASSTLFFAVKIFGCFYLVYLGIKMWKTPQIKINKQSVIEHKKERRFTAIFKQGFGVGISNPKAIAFFTALFPQFIDPSRDYIPQFLTLIFTIEGISFFILTTYAILSSMAAQYLSSGKALAFCNKLTSLAFIGFGVGLIYEK